MTTRRAIASARDFLGTGYTVPIDVSALAESHRIRLSPEPLPADVSGLLLRGEGRSTTIAVNVAHPKNRQRFTIAHELGHYRLHRGVFVNSTLAVNLRAERHAASWGQEAEANAFAAELLMPRDKVIESVRNYMQHHQIKDAEPLVNLVAQAFFVSRQAAQIRLATLGVVQSV